jgi:hypothetical protein
MPTPADPDVPNDFGLRAALGDDDTARMLRLQRDTAIRYFDFAAADRMTAWLVANGYEEASDAAS